MPTVLSFDGLRVVIYPNDHRPAHVHVIGRGKEAVLLLNCPDGPADVRENFGFSGRELQHIVTGLAASITALCQKWSEVHGSY